MTYKSIKNDFLREKNSINELILIKFYPLFIAMSKIICIFAHENYPVMIDEKKSFFRYRLNNRRKSKVTSLRIGYRAKRSHSSS